MEKRCKRYDFWYRIIHLFLLFYIFFLAIYIFSTLMRITHPTWTVFNDIILVLFFVVVFIYLSVEQTCSVCSYTFSGWRSAVNWGAQPAKCFMLQPKQQAMRERQRQHTRVCVCVLYSRVRTHGNLCFYTCTRCHAMGSTWTMLMTTHTQTKQRFFFIYRFLCVAHKTYRTGRSPYMHCMFVWRARVCE